MSHFFGAFGGEFLHGWQVAWDKLSHGDIGGFILETIVQPIWTPIEAAGVGTAAFIISDWENQVLKSGEGSTPAAHGVGSSEENDTYIKEKRKRAESNKWNFIERWADKGRAAHAIEDRKIHGHVSIEMEWVLESIDLAPALFLVAPLDPTGLLIPTAAGVGTFFAVPIQVGNTIKLGFEYNKEFYNE